MRVREVDRRNQVSQAQGLCVLVVRLGRQSLKMAEINKFLICHVYVSAPSSVENDEPVQSRPLGPTSVFGVLFRCFSTDC